MADSAVKPFQFKQFAVEQSQSSMKVGTDAILLGSWAELGEARTILDVGTGNGVLALICAQRNQRAIVRGVEIDEGSVGDAGFNFAHSPWAERMSVHHFDFLNYESDMPVDLIISNPPYFSDSIRAADPVRSKARHDDSLPAEKFMRHSEQLLAHEGRISIIIPRSRLKKWLDAAAVAHLFPNRIAHVFTLADKDATRVMVEFSRHYEFEPKMESILIEKSPGEISEAFKELTQPFYTRW